MDVEIGLIALIVFLFAVFKLGRAGFGKKKIPPGPTGLPIVGYFPFLSNPPHVKCLELANKYGKIFSFYLGRKLVVVINDFELVHEAFVKKADIFSGRPYSFTFRVFDHLNDVVSAEGSEFKAYRTFLLSTLKEAGAQKSNLEVIVSDNAEHFMERMEQKNGEPLNVLEDLGLSISQTYSRLLFGCIFPFESDWFREFIRLVYDRVRLHLDDSSIYMEKWITDLPILREIIGKAKMRKVTKKIMNHLEKQVKTLEDSYVEGSRGNFVHAWITEATNRKKINPKDDLFNRENMINNIIVVFGAGYETTTTTIRWMLILLMQKHEVQVRLQKEIDDIIGSERRPSMADEPRMPFTQSFIQEVHRYITMNTLGIQHRNIEECELGGYYIPKDSHIVSNHFKIHMDSKTFPEPEKFKADRFLRPDGTFRRAPEMLTFSVGRRACPGEPLAQCEIFIYLTYILQKYNLVNPGSQVLPGPFDSDRSGSIASEPKPFQVIFDIRKN